MYRPVRPALTAVAAPAAGLWNADYCAVRISTEYFSGGSYTSVSGVVARWDGRRWGAMLDSYSAMSALSSSSCERRR